MDTTCVKWYVKYLRHISSKSHQKTYKCPLPPSSWHFWFIPSSILSTSSPFFQVFGIQESSSHQGIHFLLWFGVLLSQESDHYILGDDCQQTVSTSAGQIRLKDIQLNSSLNQPFVRFNIYLPSHLFIIHNYLTIHLW